MKKIIPITGLVLGMSVASVYAATDITENKLDIQNGILTVGGVTDSESNMVTLNIPKQGITAAQLQQMSDQEATASILYCGQMVVGEDGAFRFTVKIPDGEAEGLYNISVGGNLEATAAESTFYMVDKNNYSTHISSLNDAAKLGKAQFDVAYDTLEQILFNYSEATSQGSDIIKNILWDFAKNSGFSTTDSVSNMSVYKAALAAQLLSENNISDAEKLLESMYAINDGTIMKYGVVADYKKYINTDEKKAYFLSVLQDSNTLAQAEKAMADALILTSVRYTENITTLKTVFDKYASFTGANTAKAKLSDYSSISGIAFASVEECVKVFNNTVGKNTSQSGGAGGGGGGGAGGGSSSKVDPSDNIGIAPPSGESHTEALSIKFEDLNSVQWAYSAISELYERKIINGRSETRFAPNDKVKREEFAKMVVDMAGLKLDNNTNSFSDIMDNAWYKGYVNTAYKNGFLNGVGNGVFGAGREISRQDMCVIAYNVIKKLGHEIPSADLTFVDGADIGEYAKAPVAALNNAGIVSGVGENRFNPKGSATRAEAAVIIYRLLKYIE